MMSLQVMRLRNVFACAHNRCIVKFEIRNLAHCAGKEYGSDALVLSNPPVERDACQAKYI